ncbi:putative inorganic carbon transporter subunit DabA [Idiomarina sp.]|uniref:putative inorganic carbon transporter subunit DabA n=1 Tax=Idiomarina sp. TaxID=1874361 RepID=UPI002EB97A01|nr:putative inorganic carbon transporter subunit DabA [Pseudomonadota bacterium]
MSEFIQLARQQCARVAPMWPLAESIAVNPCWFFTDQPVERVSAIWKYVSDIDLVMERAFYRQQLQQGQLDDMLLPTDAIKQLSEPQRLPRWFNVTDIVDQLQARQRKMLWKDEVVLQISQFCGLHTEFPERFVDEAQPDNGLYLGWLTVVREDKGIATLMGERQLPHYFDRLPDDISELYQVLSDDWLQHYSEDALNYYLFSLLIDVLGWSSALRYRDWDPAAPHNNIEPVLSLLGIRLAWDYVLWQWAKDTSSDLFNRLSQRFAQQAARCQRDCERVEQSQKILWQCQRAYEREQLQGYRLASKTAPDVEQRPTVQAAFCIDVRSEPLRRALDTQSGIKSLGVAGFFGLPIGFKSQQGKRPQLPGLLNPQIWVEEKDVELPGATITAIGELLDTPTSSLNAVEVLGLAKGIGLFTAHDEVESTDTPKAQLDVDVAAVKSELVDALAGTLTSLGIKQFGECFVWVGHSSHHENNPQRAAMNCGACGGQSGAINARLMCQLLNQADIRTALAERGIKIPEDTQFYAGLHETVTDRILPLSDEFPEHVAHAFEQASATVREHKQYPQTRSGLNRLADLFKKTRDWAEVRPEWGLADNFMMVLAPRARSATVDLQGRAFLHDYDAQHDPDASILAALISAPGVVAHWINWQYFTSVTAPARLGSGNKLLHNRVAQNVGVFEGNSGDLRMGLSLQSVWDGEQWRHRPCRLQVIIDASETQIKQALEASPSFKPLVQNRWLFLYQLDDEGQLTEVTL